LKYIKVKGIISLEYIKAQGIKVTKGGDDNLIGVEECDEK
jgi:hypothetical protein